jgi:hypothetical protein
MLSSTTRRPQALFRGRIKQGLAGIPVDFRAEEI